MPHYHFLNQRPHSYTVKGKAPDHKARASLTAHQKAAVIFTPFTSYSGTVSLIITSHITHTQKICLKKNNKNLQISHQQLLCSRVLEAVTLAAAEVF